jgi:PPOX class probable F420-dependent enzyme
MIPEEHREFVEGHKMCLVGYARKNGPPSVTPIYYYVENGEIYFSTTKARGKGRAIARNPELTITIVHTEAPYPYIMITGTAVAEDATALEVMMKVGAVMTGQPVNDSVRPVLEKRVQDEGRVGVRFTPKEFYKVQQQAGGASSSIVKTKA